MFLSARKLCFWTGALAMVAVAQGQALGYAPVDLALGEEESGAPCIRCPTYTLGRGLRFDSMGLTLGGFTTVKAETTNEAVELTYDFYWQLARGEILAELIHEEGRLARISQWGAYLQGVYDLSERFHLVARYEYFDPASDDPAVNLFTLGGVFKPLSFMALKLEYRIVGNVASNASEGLFTSFTTLF